MVDQQGVIRKLAAILYADVAGYSRLTGADEEGTHRTVADYLDAVSGLVSDHGGRVVHYAGDAVLADFPSVVTAVKCAVEIQRELAARNTNFPEDRRVQFRISVNLGDVIVDRDDIYGNGVNVAARLEGLADPGGICVSGSVLEQVQDKVNVGFEDMGLQDVKNIAKPVHAYRVVLTIPSNPTSLPPQSDKPFVAVLPFENISGDQEQEFFADGITEDIITGLSRFPNLYVVDRNSIFAHKRRAADVKQMGHELGVRYVVQGSVRRSNERVRVSVQLIDAKRRKQIWAERYDRNMEDIFVVQDDITETIIGSTAPEITFAEWEQKSRLRSDTISAYDLALKAIWQIRQGYINTDPNMRNRGLELANQVVEQDSRCLEGWMALTTYYSMGIIMAQKFRVPKCFNMRRRRRKNCLNWTHSTIGVSTGSALQRCI